MSSSLASCISPTFPRLVVILFWSFAADAARISLKKTRGVNVNELLHADTSHAVQSVANSTNDSTQHAANGSAASALPLTGRKEQFEAPADHEPGSDVSALPGTGRKEQLEAPADHEFIAPAWNRYALLEQYSVLAKRAKSLLNVPARWAELSLWKYSLFPIVCLVAALLVMLLMSLCCRKHSEEETDGEESDFFWRRSSAASEVKFEDLVRRLSKTIERPPQGKIAGSSYGKDLKKMHLSVWWGAHVHTWASTRLGWWESERDHARRQQPLNSIYLRDVTEVILTHSAEKCEPGMCIMHAGRSGQVDKLLLIFATEKVAAQYVEDFRTMVKKVKRAEAAEKDPNSATYKR